MKKITKMDDKWYKIMCSCSSESCSVDMFVENDDKTNTTFVSFYTKVGYYNKRFWEKLRDSVKVLLGKDLELEGEFIINDKEQMDNFIDVLKEGRACVSGVDEIFKVQKIKRNAILPAKAYDTDVGFDCFAPEDFNLSPGETKLIDLGFRIGLKPGWEAQMRNKSGMVTKRNVFMKLGLGTVDSEYRGSIMVPLFNLGNDYISFKRGEKIVQMVIKRVPYVVLKEGVVDTETSRGTGGFGSTSNY